MTRMVILTDALSVEVVETISGSFAVTGNGERVARNGRLTSGNFFTLDEAARAGLDLVLGAEGREGDGLDSYPDGTRREYVAGDIEREG